MKYQEKRKCVQKESVIIACSEFLFFKIILLYIYHILLLIYPKGWICHVIPIEVGCRGFLGHSVISFLSKI